MGLLEFPFDLLFFIISLLNNLKDVKNFTSTCHFLHKLQQHDEIKLIITNINRNEINKVLQKKKIIEQFPWRLNFPMKGELFFNPEKEKANFAKYNYEFVIKIKENLNFEVYIPRLGDSVLWIKFNQSVDNVYFCSDFGPYTDTDTGLKSMVDWKTHLSSIEKNTKFFLGKFFDENIEFPIVSFDVQNFIISGKLKYETKKECLGKTEDEQDFKMKISYRNYYNKNTRYKIALQKYNEYMFSNGQKAYSNKYGVLVLKK